MNLGIKNPFVKDSRNRLIIFIFLVIMVLFFSLTTDKFLSPRNWILMIINLTPVGIIAVAMTFLLISGEIDLSVGANMGLSSCLAAFLYNNGINPWLCIFAAIVAGLIIGIVNGVIVVKIGINSFIATIAMLSIVTGVAYTMTNGLAISIFSEENLDVLNFIGRGTLFGVSVPIIILVLFYVVAEIVLRNTLFGRRVYQTGANESVAKLFGINTKKVKFINYVLTGIVASFAGLILTSLTGVGMAQHGSGLEMSVISAVLLGGVALGGGKGSILGTFIGVLAMNVIYNGMVLMNVPYYFVRIMEGVILLMAVLLYGVRTEIFER